MVHAGNIQDRDGAKLVLAACRARYPAWGGCGPTAATPASWSTGSATQLGCDAGGRQALGRQHGFVVLPKRWIVERTFAWLGKCRRLSKDDEHQVESSEAMIRLAMIGLMARRLRRVMTSHTLS